MNQPDQSGESSREEREIADERFGLGLARAFGGAIVFSLPMLMTMEMWWLGFYMSSWRLALLLAVNIPLLIGLSHYIGFEDTFEFKDDALDAFVAYAVGFIAAVPILFLFAVIEPGMSWNEIIGKISLQAVPGSIGAMLAQSELGGKPKDKEDRKRRAGYWGELFIMMVGALFLAFNLAPTEEMVLIAYMMTDWHILGLILLTLIAMHAFVYALEFKGQASIPEGTPFWSVFLRFTVVGYTIALLISLFILWIFGRLDGQSLHQIVTAVIVLGFPAAIGAAAARLIL
jgi:putative integral membrane protein (TIGR02587 family)